MTEPRRAHLILNPTPRVSAGVWGNLERPCLIAPVSIPLGGQRAAPLSCRPSIRSGFPSCPGQTPGPCLSLLSAASHLWCKISSAMSFRNKYLQPLRWQEKKLAGTFLFSCQPGLASDAGVPGRMRGGIVGLGCPTGPHTSPAAPRRQEKGPGPFPMSLSQPGRHATALRAHPVVLASLQTRTVALEARVPEFSLKCDTSAENAQTLSPGFHTPSPM